VESDKRNETGRVGEVAARKVDGDETSEPWLDGTECAWSRELRSELPGVVEHGTRDSNESHDDVRKLLRSERVSDMCGQPAESVSGVGVWRQSGRKKLERSSWPCAWPLVSWWLWRRCE